jgi:hypothetical protein
MAGTKSRAKKISMAERDALMARLTLEGKSTREIGAMLDLDHGTVAARLRVYAEAWRQNALDDVASVKGKHLAKVRLVQAEAWESWRLSRGEQVSFQDEAEMPDAKVVAAIIAAGGDSKQAQKLRPTKTVTRRKTTNGDPSYLNAILVAMGQEAKLLGLNDPDTFEITDRTQLRSAQKEATKLSTAELAAMFHDGVPVGGSGEA